MNKTTLNSQKEKHSMLSLRRATSVALPGLRLHLDFYPRSPCGERQLILPVKFTAWAFLSTLSLRRATAHFASQIHSVGISIHALLAESDRERSARLLVQLLFLSTLSLRRATHESLHGRGLLPISIHALLTESDQRRQNSLNRSHNFYPRSPYGERPPSMIRQPTPTGFLSTLSLRRATM